MLKQEIGNRFRTCREELKLSQRDVAKLLNVAQPVYQRFEKGIYECTYEQLLKLSEIFDVSIDYFFGKKEF
ncbi:MAG: helix-turn-helix domain-containing protein [Christensenellales bacterium]